MISSGLLRQSQVLIMQGTLQLMVKA
jgi:hypothetical protein